MVGLGLSGTDSELGRAPSGARFVPILLLGLAAYAILRFSEISLTACLVGLFVPTAAVILEILIELIYAGT